MLVVLKTDINYLWKNKNKKLIKRSKIITQQPKLLEKLNIIDIKSVTIEHPKNLS